MSDRVYDFHGRTVVYPEEMEACCVPVLNGEYVVPRLPDEPIGPLRVLDCGAAVGAFSLFAMQRWPGCSVTCVEPDPALCGYLRRNVPEATVLEAAIVLRRGPDGMVPLWRGPNGHYGYNTTNPGATGNPCSGAVQVHGMFPHALPPCDVLKLDIEGPELGVLHEYHLLSRVSWVILEWHIESERTECEERLAAAGLRCVWGRWLDVAAGLQTWARTRARMNRGTWQYELPEVG
jgi:FkbM family methyltransferase